jgi:hypothetical protein
MVERLHHTTAGLYHHGPKEGQTQVTAQTLSQKQSTPENAKKSKRAGQKDAEGVIPFHDGEGKEEMRKFSGISEKWNGQSEP